jgi:hypothetical protein
MSRTKLLMAVSAVVVAGVVIGHGAARAAAQEGESVKVRGVIGDVTESDDGVVLALIEVDDMTLSVAVSGTTKVSVDGEEVPAEDVWDQVGAEVVVDYVTGDDHLTARSLAIQSVTEDDEEYD